MKALFTLAFGSVCSVSFSFLSAIQPASAAPEIEPNNSFSSRQFLPSSTNTVNGLLSSGDIDFFTFSGLEVGSLFTAAITSGTFDSVLGLVDDSGNILAINDDSGGGGDLSLLRGVVPDSGNLNLAVTGFADFNLTGTHFQSGSYTLSLETLSLPEPSPTPTIINGGFETGDFTGWATLGATTIETSTFGSGPTEGTFQALLSTGGPTASTFFLERFLGLAPGRLDSIGNGNTAAGSAIRQFFTAKAGDIVTFNWNFLTNEGASSPFNDFSFVSLSLLSELADTTFPIFMDSLTPFDQETGFRTFSFTIPSAGTYILGLGVTDVVDNIVNSGLLVDNVKVTRASVSEPTSIISLLTFSIFGASSLVQRKQRKA